MKRFQRLTYFNGQWLYMKSNIRKKINLFDFTVENLGFFQPHEKFSDFRNISTKQGYALKKWVEGLSDEAFCSWAGSHQKKIDKIGQPYICHQT